jgi:hypothetical protein
MKITKEQLKQIIKEELDLLEEGPQDRARDLERFQQRLVRKVQQPSANLEDLQKGSQMIRNGQEILMKKAKELELNFDPNMELTKAFNLAKIAWIEAIFKANSSRTGGKLDE